jgi:oligopeptide/dipeptide ABC transporter ATP-binding protein
VSLLEIRNLRTVFASGRGEVAAVDDVSFTLGEREVLGIVGESGSGKSVTALSIMGLLPKPPARIASGAIWFAGENLLTYSESRMRRVRGPGIGMIFQEPMTSLNPIFSIGNQLMETVGAHERLSPRARRERAITMLAKVGIAAPERRLDDYPHQLSGGMRQRVMIAMALACNPKVLLADEPTTALDVTIQAQILDIILDLQKKLGTAVILITHDLGVVAETAQRVIVMYAGRKVEEASVEDLFARPQHPYTHGLMASIPRLELMRGGSGETKRRLQEIPGIVPSLTNLPSGCTFAPRCPFADDRCRREAPAYEEKRPAHWAACWHSERLYGAGHA